MAKAKKEEAPAAEIKLVRKHKGTGAVEPRKRGRPHPDYENGYLDESGNFVAGNPVKKKGKRGRKPGPKPAGKPGRKPGRPKGTKKAAAAGGLSEIEAIVRREVAERIATVKAQVLAAVTSAFKS